MKPLLSYSYKSVDLSPISRYILRPYWEWVTVNLIPLWMAPNLITLIGTLFIFASFISAVYFSPELDEPVPKALNFVLAACLWIYSTMDNVDGKQARRTRSSSPLGELFDHGCDSLVTGMGCVMQLASLGLARSPFGMLAVFLAFWSFYLPTWEEYHTGVLYLGYINGPTEGILAFCVMYGLTGIYGPDLWKTILVADWTIEQVLGALFAVSFVLFALPSSLLNVYKSCRAKRESFISALFTLAPFTSLSMCVGLLIFKQDLTNTEHFALFMGLLTVLFGRLATSVIYAHLLNQPYPSLPAICVPLWLAPLFLRLMKPSTASIIMKPFLSVYFVVACVEYANWVYHTVNSFTRFLNISCFSLQSQPDDMKPAVKKTFAEIVKSAPLSS